MLLLIEYEFSGGGCDAFREYEYHVQSIDRGWYSLQSPENQWVHIRMHSTSQGHADLVLYHQNSRIYAGSISQDEKLLVYVTGSISVNISLFEDEGDVMRYLEQLAGEGRYGSVYWYDYGWVPVLRLEGPDGSDEAIPCVPGFMPGQVTDPYRFFVQETGRSYADVRVFRHGELVRNIRLSEDTSSMELGDADAAYRISFFPNRMQLEQALEASRPDAPELLLDQEDPLLDW